MGNDYFEALGVEAPEAGAEGAESTETAAPDTQDAGGEEQRESAAPAAEEGNGGSEEGSNGEEQSESPEQSQEENARYAAIRRRAEQEAQRRAEKELDSLISGAGLINPYTQQPISSREELIAYRTQYQQDKRREFMDAHGMDEQAYQAYVDELPEVKAARAEAERIASEGAQARLTRDLQEVRQLDPEIGGLEDLAKKPEYSRICEMVEKGLSLPEAYKLVYFDDLTSRRSEAAKQAALNAFNGKEHMQQSESRGNGAAAVPPEVAEEYRVLMPGISEAEIQSHYNKCRQAGK